MNDDEREIAYVYDEQNRLIEARWCEQPNVTVFEYAAPDLDPFPDAIDLDPLPDSGDR